MATKDEKLGRKGSVSSWGPPRKPWAKRASGKRIRKAAKEEIAKDGQDK